MEHMVGSSIVKDELGKGIPFIHSFFALAADLLQAAINKAFREGHLHASIPFVQYVDDTLIIMPACPQQILCLKDILEKYAQYTGLKINFHKSSLEHIWSCH
jgi:hypothetical protein